MTHRERNVPVLDASLRIDGLPAAGREIVVEATDEQREAIAAQLGITDVKRLQASLRAVGFRGGIRVTGHVSAVIEQPCVVTLVPVFQDIEEDVDRVFLPGVEPDKAGATHPEIFVDLEGDDLPDYFEGPEADLSGLVVETVALAIDPYPRAPGASVESLGINPPEDKDTPFAGLKALKKGGGQS